MRREGADGRPRGGRIEVQAARARARGVNGTVWRMSRGGGAGRSNCEPRRKGRARRSSESPRRARRLSAPSPTTTRMQRATIERSRRGLQVGPELSPGRRAAPVAGRSADHSAHSRARRRPPQSPRLRATQRGACGSTAHPASGSAQRPATRPSSSSNSAGAERPTQRLTSKSASIGSSPSRAPLRAPPLRGSACGSGSAALAPPAAEASCCAL